MTKGQRIKARRQELQINQTDFAKLIGVSKQSLYKYENDIITNIPSDIIERIAEKLKVSPAYIMGWHEHEERILAYAEKLSLLPPDKQNHVMQYIDFISKKED